LTLTFKDLSDDILIEILGSMDDPALVSCKKVGNSNFTNSGCMH